GHGRGAQAEAADFARPIKVERRIELRFGHHAHADAAGNAALGLATLPNAAALLFDEFAHGNAQWQFHTARLVHVAADAIELRAKATGIAGVLWVGRHADGFEPIRAALDDVRHTGYGLNVVDDGGLAKGAFHGGEGRLDPWPRPFPFQAFDQTC